MSTQSHGSLANLLMNGYDLSPFFNQLDAGGGTGTLEDTGFGQVGAAPTSKTYIPDMGDATLNAQGKYDIDKTGMTADKVADVIEAAIAAGEVGSAGASVITYIPMGDGFGKRTMQMLASVVGWDVTSPVSAIVSCMAKFQSNVGARRGAVLQPAVSLAAGTHNGATLDAGAGYDSTKWKGAMANLHVLDYGTGVTAKVQHSADGTTWVDLLTFTAPTASHQAQNKEVTATVNRYLRTVVVAASTATVHIAAGRTPAK